jgi:leucyl-tRNA synthetase
MTVDDVKHLEPLATQTLSEEEQERLALGSEKVAAQLDGGQVVKTIVVPGKLVNVVVR